MTGCDPRHMGMHGERALVSFYGVGKRRIERLVRFGEHLYDREGRGRGMRVYHVHATAAASVRNVVHLSRAKEKDAGHLCSPTSAVRKPVPCSLVPWMISGY